MKAKKNFTRHGVRYQKGQEVELPTRILEALLDEGWLESEVIEKVVEPVKVVEPKPEKAVAKEQPKEKKK